MSTRHVVRTVVRDSGNTIHYSSASRVGQTGPASQLPKMQNLNHEQAKEFANNNEAYERWGYNLMDCRYLDLFTDGGNTGIH
jgi:hypothetical protein